MLGNNNINKDVCLCAYINMAEGKFLVENSKNWNSNNKCKANINKKTDYSRLKMMKHHSFANTSSAMAFTTAYVLEMLFSFTYFASYTAIVTQFPRLVQRVTGCQFSCACHNYFKWKMYLMPRNIYSLLSVMFAFYSFCFSFLLLFVLLQSVFHAFL